MKRRLLVRGSLVVIGLAFALVSAIQIKAKTQTKAKTTDESFAELYAKIPIGANSWGLKSEHGLVLPNGRDVDDVDSAMIYNALYARKKDDAFWLDPNQQGAIARLQDRERWFRIMTDHGTRWRKYQHPFDSNKWFAVAILHEGLGNDIIACKVRCGY